MLCRFREKGLLKTPKKQRTDSSHVLAAIRILNRLEVVGETLRYALNSIATVAPDWLRQIVPHLDWYERYGQRVQDSRLPTNKKERYSLASIIGTDGSYLLDAIWSQSAPLWLRQIKAVEILRRVWLQQYLVQNGSIQLREASNLPPSDQMIRLTYDPDARYGNKRSHTWIGYKVHIA